MRDVPPKFRCVILALFLVLKWKYLGAAHSFWHCYFGILDPWYILTGIANLSPDHGSTNTGRVLISVKEVSFFNAFFCLEKNRNFIFYAHQSAFICTLNGEPIALPNMVCPCKPYLNREHIFFTFLFLFESTLTNNPTGLPWLCPFSFCRHQFCMACLRVRSDHSRRLENYVFCQQEIGMCMYVLAMLIEILSKVFMI